MATCLFTSFKDFEGLFVLPGVSEMKGSTSVQAFILCLMILLCRKGANAAETTMVFYMHDVTGGSGQTALPVVTPNGANNNVAFGSVTVIDDLITESADPSSTVVGRGQGMYVSAAQDSSNFLLVFTAVLKSPQYSNSTINFQGADRFTESSRDVSVVGGTGMFKSAQGYATIEAASVSPLSVVLKFTVALRY